jgi:hypothetical protein
VSTIEEAIAIGLKKKQEKLETKQAQKEISVVSFHRYLEAATNKHDMYLYPLVGVKVNSIIRRFIKDCKELRTTAYEVLDYLLDNYMELNHYLKEAGNSTLLFDKFDFETIYYNKKEILVWFLHTKGHGFSGVDKSVVEQAGEALGVKVIPFKKRGKK